MDYLTAENIRKTGLAASLTDKLVSGGSVGRSIKESIGESLKARAVGIKQKFDPLNIAKFLTGGSSLAPALLGRILGRSDEDISFFSSKQGRNKNKDPLFLYTVKQTVENARMNDTFADILGKIYTLFKKIDQEEILANELRRDFAQEVEEERERKNKQLEESLKKLGVKGKPKEMKEDEGPSDAGGTGGPPKEDETKKPSVFERITTTLGKTASFIGSAVGKVAMVGGIGAAAVGIKSAIAGAESGGSYEATFGDKIDKKGQVTRGPYLSPEQMFGKKLTDLTLSEVDMLGKARNKQKKNTSAMGKYQFMNETLFGRRGVPGLVQQLHLDMNERFTGDIQELLNNKLYDNNLKELKRLGVPITPGYEYMAHYVGAGGAAAVYKARNTNMTVAEAIVAAGYKDPSPSNEELRKIRAADFEMELQKRLEKRGGYNTHAARGSETPKPEQPKVPASGTSGGTSPPTPATKPTTPATPATVPPKPTPEQAKTPATSVPPKPTPEQAKTPATPTENKKTSSNQWRLNTPKTSAPPESVNAPKVLPKTKSTGDELNKKSIDNMEEKNKAVTNKQKLTVMNQTNIYAKPGDTYNTIISQQGSDDSALLNAQRIGK